MPSVYSISSGDLSSAVDGYENIHGFRLTESQVESSQNVQIYFSPDVKAPFFETVCSEGDEEEEDSVEFLGESGNDPLEVYAHHRFLCKKSDFKKDPYLHCSNYFCVVCDERASDCKEWDAHCGTSNEEYKAILRLRTSKKETDAVGPPTVAAIVITRKKTK